MRRADVEPRVFWRMTDNWVELALRFVTHDSGIREVKDKMTREMLAQFRNAGIGIASGTYEIVGMPPIKVELPPSAPTSTHAAGQFEMVSLGGDSISRDQPRR